MAQTTLTEATPTVASQLLGWDHLEWWVGNARAVTAWLTSGFGFEVVAYPGPETGVRDRVSYVLAQGDVRFVVTAGLGARQRGGPPRPAPRRRHPPPGLEGGGRRSHGDAGGRQGGDGRGRARPRRRRRRIGHDRRHRHLRRDPAPLRGAVGWRRPLGARLHRRPAAAGPGRRPGRADVHRPRGRQRREGTARRVGGLVRPGARLRRDASFRRRPDLDPVLGAAFDRRAQRRRHRDAHQRAGARPEEEPDRGVPRRLPGSRASSTSPWPHPTSSPPWAPCGPAGVRFLQMPADLLRGRPGPGGRLRPALGRSRAARHRGGRRHAAATCCRSSPRP